MTLRRIALLVLGATLLFACSGPSETPLLESTPPGAEPSIGFEFVVDPQSGTVTLLDADLTGLGSSPCAVELRRELINGLDLSSSFDSTERTGAYPFELWAEFTNISPIGCGLELAYGQPFVFEKVFAVDAVTREDLVTVEPTVTDADLGGDGILSPGETTSTLTFQVFHNNHRFYYFVRILAEVSEAVPTVWPNEISSANSDPWLVEHHREIRKMEPRVLLINFSNTVPAWQIEDRADRLVEALAESSRWHGYDDPDAPVFLEYQIVKFVDLRDASPPANPICNDGNSSKYPHKPPPNPNDSRGGFDTKQLYTEEFAQYFGYADPDEPGRYLTLAELVDRGIVNEVWFTYNERPIRNPDGTFRCGKPYEVVELKQYYDDDFSKREGPTGVVYGPAGNGHDDEMPWIGRSLRIKPINIFRGVGCSMESYGHGLEAMRHYNAVPYFTRYFREYAGFDLDSRHGLPFYTFYAYYRETDHNEYPTPTTLEAYYGGGRYPVSPYIAIGGNVHFMPNGRWHYDSNPDPVLSTIKSWRMGNCPNPIGSATCEGGDLAAPFTNADIAIYADLAPDCMGDWVVYWRQNMPGLDNLAREDPDATDVRQPMLNWWPFLFY